MRTIISARSEISLLALVLALALSAHARAAGDAQVCGPQTLSGSYVFATQGFNIVSGVAQPKGIVEGIDFNGDGTLGVPFSTVSINGLIIQVPPGGVGTYTLAATCQGTVSFTNGPSFNIFVQPGGRQAWMIQTDANTVFQGTVTKASR